MTLDPRISMWLNIIAAILIFTTSSTADLTAIFGDTAARVVVHIASYFGGVIATLNAILHAIPSKPGAAAEFPLGPKGDNK